MKYYLLFIFLVCVNILFHNWRIKQLQKMSPSNQIMRDIGTYIERSNGHV